MGGGAICSERVKFKCVTQQTLNKFSAESYSRHRNNHCRDSRRIPEVVEFWYLSLSWRVWNLIAFWRTVTRSIHAKVFTIPIIKLPESHPEMRIKKGEWTVSRRIKVRITSTRTINNKILVVCHYYGRMA